MRLKHIALAGFMGLLLLSLAATTASALRSLEFSSTVITLLSTALTFSTELGSLATCRIGLTITLNARSFAKGPKVVGRALFQNGACGMRFIGESFEVKYLSFTGTLPLIEGLNLQLERVVFLDENSFGSCQYTINFLFFQAVEPRTGQIKEARGERANSRYRIELISSRRLSGILCFGSLSAEGVFLPTGTAPTIRLI